jgi:hypothetical protein
MDQIVTGLEKMKAFFWDVDINAVDPVKHKRFVIERLLRFGTPKEVCWVLASYSRAEIVAIIQQSRNLDPKTANFWAIHFDIPQEEVRCLKMPPAPRYVI